MNSISPVNTLNNSPFALDGAVLSAGGRSMPDLWRIFHSNTTMLIRFSSLEVADGMQAADKMVADAEHQLCQELASIPAKDWIALCTASGWTLTGAAALSWCKDATDYQLWDLFRKALPVPEANPAFIRATRLINPALLPQGKRLSDMFYSAKNDSYAVCAACVVNASTVLVDYPPEQIKQLAYFLPPFLNALGIDCFANVPLPTGRFDTRARG